MHICHSLAVLHPTFCPVLPQSLFGTCLCVWPWELGKEKGQSLLLFLRPVLPGAVESVRDAVTPGQMEVTLVIAAAQRPYRVCCPPCQISEIGSSASCQTSEPLVAFQKFTERAGSLLVVSYQVVPTSRQADTCPGLQNPEGGNGVPFREKTHCDKAELSQYPKLRLSQSSRAGGSRRGTHVALERGITDKDQRLASDGSIEHHPLQPK